ncbi:MAG: phage tail protein [Oscillospiraceae bacterium]|nr:phage tail protein [Oscillospiraceae bacterium]
MADTFGLKIGLEGEKEFKKALSDINQSFKVLGSEMKLVQSQFSKNDNSAEALAARTKTLTSQIDAQKQKIEMLQKALQNASESFGENDRRTQNWQIQLNNAKAALNDMERELDDCSREADDMGEELEDAAEAAEDSEKKFSGLGSVLKSVGAAMGTVAVAAGAATIKLATGVIEQFGELEQNMGGAVAVYGDYANELMSISEEAYRTMGTSQSEYLATANKMGALFQGSGLTQQQSLEMTTQAMQRAADMASVMGIDTEAALEAVTGAAKGNYSMMDNLGVAMNNTTLEAYAMANGYEKAWKEMSNAEKAEVSMAYFLEKTQQYAGNFEREATQTISGSIGLMKASIDSFVAGLGNADADMQNLTQNMVDAFGSVKDNVLPVLQNIVDVLPIVVATIIMALGDLLPMLLQTVTDLFSSVLTTLLSLLPELTPATVQAILTITQALIDNLPLIVEAAVLLVTTLVGGFGSALPELIPTAVEAVVTIVSGLLDSMPLVLDAALQLMTGLTTGTLDALPVLIAALPTIVNSVIDFFLGSIPQIIQTGFQLITSLITALPSIITTILTAVPQIIDNLVTATLASIPQIVEAGIQLLISLIQALPQIITTILTAIPQIIGGITNALTNNIGLIASTGFQVFVALIKNLPSMIVEIVRAVPQIIAGIVQAFTSSMGQISNVGANIVRGLWQGIQSLAGWLWNKVSAWIRSIWDGICNFFGIHSPSDLFDWAGQMMVQGLAGAISRDGDEAVKATLDMSHGISDAVNDLAADMNTSLAPEITVKGTLSNDVSGVSASSGQTTINIYPQTLDQATIDYLFLKFNARLGAAI